MFIFLVLSLVLSGSALPASFPAQVTCSPVGFGLNAMPPLCSATLPCDDLLPTYLPSTSIDFADTALPGGCVGDASGSSATKDDGAMKSINVGGVTRYYCEYGGPGQMQLPVVMFFHGSGSTAKYAWDKSGFRAQAETYALKSGSTGYLVIGFHARNHHWPSDIGEDGSKWNYIYRDWAQNTDFAFVDTVLDSLVASNKVDPAYVFISGHSNGAMFAQAYAIIRHTAGTPGGNRVRAAAVYSANDPFGDQGTAGDNDCVLASYPVSSVPIFMIHRDCDIWDCDRVKQWMNTDLPNRVQSVGSQLLLLEGSGNNAASDCDYGLFCVNNVNGALNHIEYPIGRQIEMLNFLRDSATLQTGAPSKAPTKAPSSASQTGSPSSASPSVSPTVSPTVTPGAPTRAPSTAAPSVAAPTPAPTASSASCASLAASALLAFLLLLA